jgi:hypothetical protein
MKVFKLINLDPKSSGANQKQVEKFRIQTLKNWTLVCGNK